MQLLTLDEDVEGTLFTTSWCGTRTPQSTGSGVDSPSQLVANYLIWPRFESHRHPLQLGFFSWRLDRIHSCVTSYICRMGVGAECTMFGKHPAEGFQFSPTLLALQWFSGLQSRFNQVRKSDFFFVTEDRSIGPMPLGTHHSRLTIVWTGD